jgi:RNA polymerase sigma-70 factor (ECF subfamily)
VEPGERTWIESVAAHGSSPEESLLRRERRAQIGAAVGKLPERQRTIFLLCHLEGCSSKEVGTITGLNESTVRVHLFRAVRRLRSLLGGNL